MYIFPGYTEHYEKDGAIFITSNLRKNTVKLTDPSIQEEFRSIIRRGGCSKLSTPLAKLLHEQELLENTDEIKLALEEVKELLERSIILIIMPTEGCNFRCPYCYEDHTPISMTRQMLDQIQTYISEQVPKFQSVVINWFGGEPTLCKDIILETSTLVQSLQYKHHFQYNAGMTTNGYLLNLNNFQQFYAAGITNYQITLDGWNHDQTRPHVSGKGTLQTILSNLKDISSLSSEKFPFHIILRHNILAGDQDYSWYDYLYDLFGMDKRFSVSVKAIGNLGGETVTSLNLLEGSQKEPIISAHIAYLTKLGMNQEDNSDLLLSRICYASYPHELVFRADGKIEKCTVAMNHPKNLVGRLDPINGIVLNESINQSWCCSNLNEKCYTCPDILSCLNMACRRRCIINGNEFSCT